jgi:hypothetical protein
MYFEKYGGINNRYLAKLNKRSKLLTEQKRRLVQSNNSSGGVAHSERNTFIVLQRFARQMLKKRS